jgi:hypothetical protein
LFEFELKMHSSKKFYNEVSIVWMHWSMQIKLWCEAITKEATSLNRQLCEK